MRTAAEDTTVRGVPIAKGESVYLAYVSGNRDEEVFDEPFRFDVGRDPNKHVAFGYGVHFCLGAALARMEMNSLFTELVPAPGVHRIGRRARAVRDDVRRRTQAPADSLLASVIPGGPSRCVARNPSTAAYRNSPVVEVGNVRQPAESERADQQRDRHCAVDLARVPRPPAGCSKIVVERCGVLFGDAFTQRLHLGAVLRAAGALRRATARCRGPASARTSRSAWPAPRRSTRPSLTTIAISRSRRDPSPGGIGAGGIRLRERRGQQIVCAGEMAVQRRPGDVGAAGDRVDGHRARAARAQQRRRSIEQSGPRAGRPRIFTPAGHRLRHLPPREQDYRSRYETVSLKTISTERERRQMVDTLARSDQDIDANLATLSTSGASGC